MTDIANFGQAIDLYGKSGDRYSGRIYDKHCSSTFTGRAIVCLSNSSFSNHEWNHAMNSVYKTEDVLQAVLEFEKRDDISHLIIIPLPAMEFGKSDMVDDLIRHYLHHE